MQTAPPANEKRNELFQSLKPSCVRISQLAIREPDQHVSAKEMQALTGHILDILEKQTRKDPSAIDEKLAEYIFFPLYHIFRQMSLFPSILIENCVKCLHLIVVHGWKSRISAELVRQIFDLLTFIISKKQADGKPREVPEELALEAVRALTALFRILEHSSSAVAGLENEEALPSLGFGVTALLDNVADGSNDVIQTESLRALQGLCRSLKDQEALANFLPGLMSSMTRVLSTPKRHKRSVIVQCIRTVTELLTRVLGDVPMALAEAAQARKTTPSDEEEKNRVLGKAWLKATTEHVKSALARIMKLRTHDAWEVRVALEDLCLRCLDECHKTLSQCSSFLIDTAIVLYDADKPSSSLTNLVAVAQIYPELAQEIKNAVFRWLASLARVMQGGDQERKHVALHDLSKGIGLVKELGLESSSLEEALASSLRESVAALMAGQKQQINGVSYADVSLLHHTSSEVLSSIEGMFPPILLNHNSQKDIRKEMGDLILSISSSNQAGRLALNMMEHLQAANSSTQQLVPFWLCLEMAKSTLAQESQYSDLLTVEDFDSPSGMDEVLNELYDFSVEILDSHSDAQTRDWRLEALALEVTAWTAQRAGKGFQPELIDVLFPIVSLLGSESPSLRQHTMVALNSLASSCGYVSVSDLIIDNVDYMVNSVALRLNTLDISPASIQVLTMMIRLTGPRLVPFLDDVVDSIFSALENYHGYPLFVESLFSVLEALVQQAVGSDQILLDSQKGSPVNHEKRRAESDGLGRLSEFIDRRLARQKRDREEDEMTQARNGHPRVPWDSNEETRKGDEDDDDNAGGPPPEPEKPPNTTTYQLLLRVSNLTQHYLTSPSPRLRRSLLELLSKAAPALAADEEAFLPLVNVIWPVVVERLKDEEAFVATEACDALAGLCSAAGDFLASRFSAEWESGLRDWCRKTKQQASIRPKPSSSTKQDVIIPNATGGKLIVAKSLAATSEQSSGSLGLYASPAKLWAACVRLLTAMVRYVRLSDGMFGDILDLLADIVDRSSEVRDALETINADAVWLSQYQLGHVDWIQEPVLAGIDFPRMDKAAWDKTPEAQVSL